MLQRPVTCYSKGYRRDSQSRYLIVAIVDGHVISPANAMHTHDRGAAGLVIHKPLTGRHAAECLSQVTTACVFAATGLP